MSALATGKGTLAGLLALGASERPAAEFLVFDDFAGTVERRSYEETFERARRTAGLLQRMGVDAGDSVHVHLGSCPEFYDVWFGTALIGAVMVPTNPLLTAGELGYVVVHARCKLSITEPELLDAVRSTEMGARRILVTRSKTPEYGALSFDDELQRSEPGVTAGPQAATDVAAVLYTSGTTSRPKGVLVTHANYLHAGRVVARHLEVTPADRMLISLPLFHANAQYYSAMPALVAGSSIVVMARFSASRWADTACRHGATLASLFAAPIRMLLAQPERDADADNELRAVIFSQNLTPDQLETFENRFGCPLLQLYGMTETIAPPTLNPLNGPRRNMSIGPPTAGTRVRIVDTRGRTVNRGAVGELLVGGERGSTLMAGYLGDEEATKRAIVDGWLHTGDHVRTDDHGYLYFVDRAKDIIKRAGENVAASEVEAVVNSHPAVFESAAIGIPDAMRDEAIKVFVVLENDAGLSDEELSIWCTDRLANFKVPSAFEFIDELPRTSVGKIRKDVLRLRELDSVEQSGGSRREDNG